MALSIRRGLARTLSPGWPRLERLGSLGGDGAHAHGPPCRRRVAGERESRSCQGSGKMTVPLACGHGSRMALSECLLPCVTRACRGAAHGGGVRSHIGQGCMFGFSQDCISVADTRCRSGLASRHLERRGLPCLAFPVRSTHVDDDPRRPHILMRTCKHRCRTRPDWPMCPTFWSQQPPAGIVVAVR